MVEMVEISLPPGLGVQKAHNFIQILDDYLSRNTDSLGDLLWRRSFVVLLPDHSHDPG
jgi:hypothetical protein